MPTWARNLVLEMGPPKVGQQHPRRLKLRICVSCNSKMAARYENTTAELLKPIVKGPPVRGLAPEAQSLIGRWIIKTTLLFIIRDAIPTGVDHRRESDALLQMNRGALPPDGFSVRVGHFLADDDPADRPGEGLRGSLLGAKPLALFAFHTLGHVVMEVVAGPPDRTLDFIDRTNDDERFLRVWPPSDKVADYNPAGILTNNDVDVMRLQMLELNGVTRCFRHTWGPDA